jgi:hypothetical protein
MMSDENDELKGYFTITEEKVRDLLQNTNTMYYIVADMLQENIIGTEVAEWDDQPINALMQYYMSLANLRVMIDNIITNPPKDIVKIAKKNKIKGLLIKGEDLLQLNQTLLDSEQACKILETEYKIVINLH